MEFVIGKCAKIKMKKGKRERSVNTSEDLKKKKTTKILDTIEQGLKIKGRKE